MCRIAYRLLGYRMIVVATKMRHLVDCIVYLANVEVNNCLRQNMLDEKYTFLLITKQILLLISGDPEIC